MMITTRMLYARASALPAIAAALALSSTPLFAQETQPVTTEPAPVTATPAPAVDEVPVTPDPTAVVPADTPTARITTRTIKRTTHVATAKPAPVVTRTVTTKVTHAAVPAMATAPIPPTASPAPPAQSKVTPVVDLNAKPAQPAVASTAKPSKPDNTVPLAAGGALALLALGGTAIGLSRRRRSDEEQWVEDDTLALEPVDTVAAPEPIVHQEQPAIIAPSAFAWGNVQPAEQHVEEQAEDDRLPGESWVERAYRGPTPGNPSVSLKNRLRRAAFFDKREREVAAGTAERVDTDAGLPEAMVDEQASEREFA